VDERVADLINDYFLPGAWEVHEARRVLLRYDVMKASVSSAFQQPVYIAHSSSIRGGIYYSQSPSYDSTFCTSERAEKHDEYHVAQQQNVHENYRNETVSRYFTTKLY